jgi:hypothetical protein
MSNKRIGTTLFVTWIGLLVFAVLDTAKVFGTDIGIAQTLATSSFARGMFVDIGVLSTLMACYIVFTTRLKARYIVALLTLFVGSFAALPYLAYYFYFKKG